MERDTQSTNNSGITSSQRKDFCLLFCGLVLAYRKDRRPVDCIQMMGLPPQYARLVSS